MTRRRFRRIRGCWWVFVPARYRLRLALYDRRTDSAAAFVFGRCGVAALLAVAFALWLLD